MQVYVVHLLHINYLRTSLLLPVSKFPNKNTLQHGGKIFAFGAAIAMERQIKKLPIQIPKAHISPHNRSFPQFSYFAKDLPPPSRVVFLRHSLSLLPPPRCVDTTCAFPSSLSLSQEYSPFFLRTNSGKREDAILIVRWGGIFKLHQTLSHGVCRKKEVRYAHSCFPTSSAFSNAENIFVFFQAYAAEAMLFFLFADCALF